MRRLTDPLCRETSGQHPHLLRRARGWGWGLRRRPGLGPAPAGGLRPTHGAGKGAVQDVGERAGPPDSAQGLNPKPDSWLAFHLQVPRAL